MPCIVFEGGEGVGKTTQAALLLDWLKKQGKPCLATREPGGTPFGERIRQLFKQGEKEDSPLPLTELLLVSAARAQHLQKVIVPAMEKNQIVVCDRFLDSTYVYQSIVGKISKQSVDAISRVVLLGFVPHLTLILTCETKNSMHRVTQDPTRTQTDRMDSGSQGFYSRIHEGYKTLFKEKYSYPNGKVPHRVLIDTLAPVELVFEHVRHAVCTALGMDEKQAELQP